MDVGCIMKSALPMERDIGAPKFGVGVNRKGSGGIRLGASGAVTFYVIIDWLYIVMSI